MREYTTWTRGREGMATNDKRVRTARAAWAVNAVLYVAAIGIGLLVPPAIPIYSARKPVSPLSALSNVTTSVAPARIDCSRIR